MFACEFQTDRRLAPEMLFLFFATGTRIEAGPNIPLVERRTEVVERAMMLSHRTEYRWNQQIPADKADGERLTGLHVILGNRVPPLRNDSDGHRAECRSGQHHLISHRLSTSDTILFVILGGVTRTIFKQSNFEQASYLEQAQNTGRKIEQMGAALLSGYAIGKLEIICIVQAHSVQSFRAQLCVFANAVIREPQSSRMGI